MVSSRKAYVEPQVGEAGVFSCHSASEELQLEVCSGSPQRSPAKCSMYYKPTLVIYHIPGHHRWIAFVLITYNYSCFFSALSVSNFPTSNQEYSRKRRLGTEVWCTEVSLGKKWKQKQCLFSSKATSQAKQTK